METELATPINIHRGQTLFTQGETPVKITKIGKNHIIVCLKLQVRNRIRYQFRFDGTGYKRQNEYLYI